MISFVTYALTIVCIYGMLSLSLSVQFGQTGLVNFGQVAFFMIGAYFSSIVTVLFGWPVIVGFGVAIVVGGILGLLMALPIGDLRQDYWAIVTLAAAELIRIIFLNVNLGSPYVGASYGITGIPHPWREHFTSDGYGIFYLVLALACLTLAYLLVRWITRSPFGRVLKATRDNDEVAMALGKDVARARIGAMVIGGAIAAAGGSLFAHFVGFIDPTYFKPIETFLVWAMVILGGPGNHFGAIVGTLIIQGIYNSTRFFNISADYASTVASLRMVLIGLLIVLIILYLPRGLVPERARRYLDKKPKTGTGGDHAA